MKKIISLFFVALEFVSCNSKQNLKLKFLDEFILEDSLSYKKSLIGGLSGVDYANGFYYFVVDDVKNPRYVISEIEFNKDTITSLGFLDVIFLNDSTETFYKENALDLESIFVDKKTLEVNLVSEGSIRRGKNPLVFSVDSTGMFKENYKIPDYFKANSSAKPKHNATFESSSKSFDNKGFWVGMEGVLQADGEEPVVKDESSPIRITYFDNKTNTATKQFGYELDKISSLKGNVNLNGVTAILEFKKNEFFIVERAYKSGLGTYGNTIKIYHTVIDESTTNILDINSLKKANYNIAEKQLLFNFDTIKDELTKGIIDNIEGITFGPILANGNKSLLLVSDDNFQKYGKQLNQFLLLEIEESKPIK